MRRSFFGKEDKAHLQSGEVSGLLTDVVRREGCNEVVDGDAHDGWGSLEAAMRTGSVRAAWGAGAVRV